MAHNINNLEPSSQLYKAVRGGFIVAGTTLTAWCRKNGVNPSNARHCLVGSWDGPKAKELRAELVKAANVPFAMDSSVCEHALKQSVA